jgi:hypothetical protein
MRIILIAVLSMVFVSCDPSALSTLLDRPLTTADIASGLKEALDKGSISAANTLSLKDGFYKSAYKILLPDEARAVTDKLKIIPGFKDVEEIVLEKINRAAEDAAQKAAPIFIAAIKEMSIQDAISILKGEKNAATQYLHRTTNQKLYNEFQPIVLNSLNQFNAVDYWEDAVNKYNKLPLVSDINPRIDDHVVNKSLEALFDLIEKKEYQIRTDISERTTDLLRKVFAQQG